MTTTESANSSAKVSPIATTYLLPFIGYFGEMRLCVHRETQVQRCVKVIRKNKLSDQNRKNFQEEFKILTALDHPNIMRMFEFFEDEKRYYVIGELCKGGELFDEMQRKGRFTEKDAAIIIKQILTSINHCHANGICHRDIKPENIMMEDMKRLDQLKLIDFGTACHFTEKNPLIFEKRGTPYYIAPEVLAEKYTAKCDVWSVGVIAYLLLSASPPFNGKDENEILAKVKEGKLQMV